MSVRISNFNTFYFLLSLHRKPWFLWQNFGRRFKAPEAPFTRGSHVNAPNNATPEGRGVAREVTGPEVHIDKVEKYAYISLGGREVAKLEYDIELNVLGNKIPITVYADNVKLDKDDIRVVEEEIGKTINTLVNYYKKVAEAIEHLKKTYKVIVDEITPYETSVW